MNKFGRSLKRYQLARNEFNNHKEVTDVNNIIDSETTNVRTEKQQLIYVDSVDNIVIISSSVWR